MFFQQFGIPTSIIDSVPTDTPAGRDARTLLELFLAVTDVQEDKYDKLTVGIDYPDGLWCNDDSNLGILSEDEILNNPDNPLISEAYAQSQRRMDDVVMILHPLLTSYRVAVVMAMTWAFVEFGRIGREIKGHGNSVRNPSFYVHLEQMARLGLRSPLL
jgi:hypothetical protein